MIIKCVNCNKNFYVDSGLIPEKGRLLQCNACDHKWFFKKEITERSAPLVEINATTEEPTLIKNDASKVETEAPKTIKLLDKDAQDTPVIEKISIQKNNKSVAITREDKKAKIKTSTNKKSYNILSLIIVFIISFIAIIIVLDTFLKPISMFVPNIEFILYNLYESINDIVLFISDLI